MISAGRLCTFAVMALSSWGADSGALPSTMQTQVKAAFSRFVAGQNTRDPSVVSDVLVRSPEFVWAQGSGRSIWGFDDAMAAWKSAWKGSWHLGPQLDELRITRIAPNVALLITPLLLTAGDPGEQPSTDPVRWAGVFVKTASGWRISSLVITPYPEWGKH
jgi:ketosteroid isomerase-like protein